MLAPAKNKPIIDRVIHGLGALAKKADNQHFLNFSSYFLSKALSLALFAAAVSYFIRENGVYLYGVVTLILLMYTYLQIVDLGMGYAVVYRLGRSMAKGRRANARIVAEALPIYLFCSVIVPLIIGLSSGPLARFVLGNEAYQPAVYLTAVGVSCLIISSLCVAVMQAHNRIYLVNGSRLLFDLVKAVALIACTFYPAQLNTFAAAMLAGAVLKLIVDAVLAASLLKTFSWMRPVWSRRSLLVGFRLGAPMFSASAIFAVVSSIDKVFVAKVFSPETLAIYSIATDLHVKAYFLLWAVTGSLYTPLIHRLARRESVSHLIWLAAIAVTCLLILYFFPLAVFGRQILTTWINANVGDQGYILLWWMLIPTIIYLLANVIEVYLQTSGNVKELGWAYLGALVVIGISLCTLPALFGIVGVVLSVSLMHLTLLLIFVALLVKYKKKLDFNRRS